MLLDGNSTNVSFSDKDSGLLPNIHTSLCFRGFKVELEVSRQICQCRLSCPASDLVFQDEPRPPQLPSNIPTYPLLRAIKALVKGSWGLLEYDLSVPAASTSY